MANKASSRLKASRNPVERRYAHVTGWGTAVPNRIMTNNDIEKLVDTSDEWIRNRTGIGERRIAEDRESTVTLGLQAARKALDMANVLPPDIDLIIVATSTPQFLFPATANLIQDKLGATRAGGFDLLAACTGFIYGLSLAAAQIESGLVDTAVVIGTETLSRIVDWTDRSTCILFGDGAGAFVLQAHEAPGGIRCSVLHSDGSGSDYLYARSTVRPTLHTTSIDSSLNMNGREVFRFASRVMAQATEEVVEKAGLTVNDVDIIIPHQANLRIIQAAARNLKIPEDRFFVNIEHYGNTSTASIPLAVAEAVQLKRVAKNDRVVLVGFGAGLTWGAVLLDWDVEPTPTSALRDVVRDAWYVLAQLRSLARRLVRLAETILFRRARTSTKTAPSPEDFEPKS